MRSCALTIALALAMAGGASRAASLADRVVIVCNALDPGSLAVAEHYRAARAIPSANIVRLDLPDRETITWDEFVPELWQPLQDTLIARGWITAGPPQGRDGLGRTIYAISGHRLAALVTCRGVPLRIAEDDSRLTGPMAGPDVASLHTNAGAVDSELSLLAHNGPYPINGCVLNPLFGNDRPSRADEQQIVKVTRLDGPTVADAEALVDSALAAEREGLIGRAYVDMGGPYAAGDEWLAHVAELTQALGFDTEIDRSHGTFSPWSRFDAPALYAGWYARDVDGPFTVPGFRFPPGAIAIHIHSFSAVTLRSATSGWTGPLVARGAAVTVGNVWEPYLYMTHRPDLFFFALARGLDVADAAYYALPSVSWQGVTIGDPLYRPFKVGLPTQMQDLSTLPDGLADYVVLRRANLMDKDGVHEEARPFLQAAYDLRPSLVLAIALGNRERSDPRAVSALLEPYLQSTPTRPTEWPLFAAAADLLASVHEPGAAEAAYRHLLAVPSLPLGSRAHWLLPAAEAAQSAGDFPQAKAWRHDLREAVTAMIK